MISLDQVYLLEQKVESAVEKIQQLQAENDALRNKCTELTNALSVKSEQLSNFESDQSQIENGIKKALDRLNSIENSVLKTASQTNQTVQSAPSVQAPAQPKPVPVQNTPAPQAEKTAEQPVQPEPIPQTVTQTTAPSFDTMDTIESEISAEEEEMDVQEDDNHDGLGFDIF
jgi:FtsZ-binding cell division protein ZapB